MNDKIFKNKVKVIYEIVDDIKLYCRDGVE